MEWFICSVKIFGVAICRRLIILNAVLRTLLPNLLINSHYFVMDNRRLMVHEIASVVDILSE